MWYIQCFEGNITQEKGNVCEVEIILKDLKLVFTDLNKDTGLWNWQENRLSILNRIGGVGIYKSHYGRNYGLWADLWVHSTNDSCIVEPQSCSIVFELFEEQDLSTKIWWVSWFSPKSVLPPVMVFFGWWKVICTMVINRAILNFAPLIPEKYR